MRFHDAGEALRAAVLARFARLDGHQPVRCVLNDKRKIVFDTREAATGAAIEFGKLDGRPRYVHPCGTHWHTTRRKQKPTERGSTSMKYTLDRNGKVKSPKVCPRCTRTLKGLTLKMAYHHEEVCAESRPNSGRG